MGDRPAAPRAPSGSRSKNGHSSVNSVSVQHPVRKKDGPTLASCVFERSSGPLRALSESERERARARARTFVLSFCPERLKNVYSCGAGNVMALDRAPKMFDRLN